MSNYYQNQHFYDVAVPTAEGVDVNLQTGEVVEGDFYSVLEYHGILVNVPGPYTYPVLRYSWPSSWGGSGGAGSITGVSCTSPIVGGGMSGTVGVALSPQGITTSYLANGAVTTDKLADGAVTLSKIALGNIVTGIITGVDTFTDDITLAAGTGILLTPTALTNTITVGLDPSTAVASVTGVLPISVVTTLGVAEVSIDVTPTNNGGAVALQTDINGAEYQAGFAALNNLFIKQSGTNTNDSLLSVLDSVGSTYLVDFNADLGILFSQSFLSAFDVGGKSLTIYDTVSYSKDNANTGNIGITLSYMGSYFGVPMNIGAEFSLSGNGVAPDSHGNIVGTQGSSYTLPFISLTGNSGNTTPLIKLASSYVDGVVNNTNFIEVSDVNSVPLIKLWGDGIVEAKKFVAKQVTYTNIFLPAGQYNVVDYEDANVFIFDATIGTTSINLPTLNANSTNGQVFVFKKYDVTISPVQITPAQGQTIDGTLTSWTLRQHGDSVRLMSVINNGSYFWVMLDCSSIPVVV